MGLKCDLERNVTTEEIIEFTKAHDIPYVEASAKQSINVSLPFKYIVFFGKEDESLIRFSDEHLELTKREANELFMLNFFLCQDTKPHFGYKGF